MSEADAALTDQKSASRRGVAARREPDAVDRRLINALQGDFPLLEAPFAAVGASLGLSEDEVIATAILLHAGYNAIVVLGDRAPWIADPRLAWLGLLAPLLLLFPARVPGSGQAATAMRTMT